MFTRRFTRSLPAVKRQRLAAVQDGAAIPPSSAGWLIPLDPLLRVQTAPDAWVAVLAQLRAHAA